MEEWRIVYPMAYQSPRWWKRGGSSHEHLDTKLIHSLSGKGLPSWKQLKYVSRVLSKREYLVLRALLCVIAINVGFLGWQFYRSQTEIIPAYGGRYIEGLVGTPLYVNPLLLHTNDTDRDLSRLIYAGLSRYDTNRRIVPDLSEKFDVSPDQKTFTFTLRKNLSWHDGEPLTADDVVFTVERIKDRAYKSPLAASFTDVSIEKVDEWTVRFSLPKPFAPFLDLTTVGILPAHLWQSVPPESFTLTSLNLKAIGSGGWKFKTLQKDRDGTIRSYTLSRNDQYFGEKSYLDEITFKFYPDIDSAVQALKNRNVEGISFLPRSLRDKLSQDKDLQYYIFNLPQYTAIFFNQLNNPDLKSLAVRAALSLTIDRNRIIRDALNSEGTRIAGPLLPGFLGYDEALSGDDYNPEKARSLLEAAGWRKDPENGQWIKTEKSSARKTELKKRTLSVTLLTVNQEENVRVAEMVKDEWIHNGFSVNVQFADPTRIKQDVIDPRSYEAFLYGEIVGADPDLYPFWHSSQARSPGLNLALYSDATSDTLLEEGRSTTDSAQRAKAYRAFQKNLLQSTPSIFLYSPTYNYVVSTKLRGIADKKQIVYPSDRFIDISSWYSKSRRVWKSTQ